jgi:hypothetical protein
MTVLTPPTLPNGHDSFPGPVRVLRPAAQSPEGRTIDEMTLDVSRSWQRRTEILRDMNNRRRLFLIDKKFHSAEGLSAVEEEELHRFQTEFEAYLDAVRPLPYQMLDELEELAQQLEAEDEQP